MSGFDKDEFRSLILRYEFPFFDEGVRSNVIIFINEKASPVAAWYFLAHEIGHLVLHWDKLTVIHEELVESFPDSGAVLAAASRGLESLDGKHRCDEEEANFFAQLCFWPVRKVFKAFLDDRTLRLTALEEVTSLLVGALASYANEAIVPWVQRPVSLDRLRRLAASFVNRYRLYFGEEIAVLEAQRLDEIDFLPTGNGERV